MPTPINIGLLGFGTVGAQVYQLLQRNAAVHAPKLMRPLKVLKIAVRDTQKKRQAPETLFTRDVSQVAKDPEIAIVVEVMGDCPEALAAITAALSSGKHVVTANKALLARHGPKLFEIAQRHHVKILYEASVAGSIPILRVIREGLSANRILKLRGIINGTCNYILSEMAAHGADFATVLKTAQELGFAEADPASDVDGHDSAYKLSILIMLCYGVWVPVEEIHTEGIRNVNVLDMEMAARFNYAVKLMGITRMPEDGLSLEARVHPVMVSLLNPIAHVSGAFNAVQYEGDFSGIGMVYGRGAGGAPTASAVVSDILEIAQGIDSPGGGKSPTGYALAAMRPVSPVAMNELSHPYYLRFTVIDKPNVLAQIATLLGSHGISIQHVYQHGQSEERRETPVIVFTHRAREWDVSKALAEIDKLNSVVKPAVMIRIEEE